MRPKALPTAFLLGFVLAVAVAGGIWGARLLDAQDDFASVAPGDYRYYNVSVSAPAEPLRLRRVQPITFDTVSIGSRPRIVIYDPTTETTPSLEVDSITGEVLHDNLSLTYPDEVGRLSSSIRLHEGLPNVWPFSDDGVPADVDRAGRLSFRIPPPESGITLALQSTTCLTPCAAETLVVTYASESAGAIVIHIDTSSGEVIESPSFETSPVEVRDALMRYADSITSDSADSEG